MVGALFAIEEADPLFRLDSREVIQRCFARFFDGAILEGPPWRIDPTEPFPTKDEWLATMEIFL